MKTLLAALAVCGLATAAPVEFADSIHPIFASRCASCHSGTAPQGGLSLDSREAMIKGGASGPAVVPGEAGSLLLKRVKGQGGPAMPMTGPRLTEAQINTLTQWVLEGAAWTNTSAKAAPSSKWVPPLAPRTPELPASRFSHPVDRFLEADLQKRGKTMPEPVPDAAFLRRIHFDLTGLPPTVEEFRSFLADTATNKREKAIDALLADSERYTGHWISFWNDLLRNDQGVIYHGDRKSITPWLRRALESNMPYDRMVSKLLNPVELSDPEGFLIGVNWRGDINASQTPYMQAAQNTAQIFLGINLKCASCHDSFINRYRLRQSYGLAAMFSTPSELELVRCDAKTGQRTGAEFLYPELGSVPPQASPWLRRAFAARFFTDPRNGRVDRTLVNRYWRQLFGHGLVEPVDEMDNEPWNADLLDWLASDFAAQGHDLKKLLRLLMTSRAYQSPTAEPPAPASGKYEYSGPIPRRLSAEQFSDTVSAITGEWRVESREDGARFAREWLLKATPLSRALGRPIRDQVFTTRNDEATTLQALELVNGDSLALALRRGAKRLLGEMPPPPRNLYDSRSVRGVSQPFSIPIRGVRELWLLIEDAGSYDPQRTVPGWLDMELVGPRGAVPLRKIATSSRAEWKQLQVGGKPVREALVTPFASPAVFLIEGQGFTSLRGRVAIDDAGRISDVNSTVRFFVFDKQPDRQQLEAVSGEPPAPIPASEREPGALVERLFWQTIGRAPSERERAIAAGYFRPGGGAAQGLEDLLWTLLLHPETQYIN